MTKQVSSEAEFAREIAQPKLVVVDFFATWFVDFANASHPSLLLLSFPSFRCGPCKMVAPMLEQLAGKYKQVKFIKVDVDQLPKLAQSCGVTAMPTFAFFKSNKMVAENIRGGDISSVEATIVKHGASSFDGHGRTLGSSSSGAPNAPNAPHAGQTYKNPNAPQDRPTPKIDDHIPDEYLEADDETLKKLIAAQTKTIIKPKAAQSVPSEQPQSQSQGEVKPQIDGEAAPKQEESAATTTTPQVSQEEVMKAIRAMVNQDIYGQLMEMGFTEVRVLKALVKTGSESLDAAVNWIEQNQGNADIDGPIEFTVASDEEKSKRIQAEKERLKQVLEAKRHAKLEAEKQQQIEREKQRRIRGKETQDSAEKFKEERRKIEAEQARKEKERALQEKTRVKRKLEEDKLRRRLERAQASNNQEDIQEIEKQLSLLLGVAPSKQTVPSAQPATVAVPQAQPVAQAQPPQEKKEECLLQIRLLDGTTIKATFKPTDTLQAVKNHCIMLQNNNQRINLMTNFPRHTYAGEEYKKSLKDLGLTKGSLICTQY